MITMKQLAEGVNISRSTVAYTLTDHWRSKRVSLSTREEFCEKLINTMPPNQVASSLKRGSRTPSAPPTL
jgi:DNA-binding LacI/PurR family transcriptional regulator